MKTIIDPKTLTEKQREAIKKEIIPDMYKFLRSKRDDKGFYGAGIYDTINQLFGEDFFEKGGEG